MPQLSSRLELCSLRGMIRSHRRRLSDVWVRNGRDAGTVHFCFRYAVVKNSVNVRSIGETR